MKPKGKYVLQVCLGTSCYVKGGDKIPHRLKKTGTVGTGLDFTTGRFSLKLSLVVGACAFLGIGGRR